MPAEAVAAPDSLPLSAEPAEPMVPLTGAGAAVVSASAAGLKAATASGSGAGSTARRIAAATLLVAFFFVLSRITGLAREIVIGARFGTSAEYDAYLAAFRVPDLIFQLVAGGALGSAFIPVFAGYWVRDERPQAWLLFSRVLNIVTAVMVVLAGVAALLAAPLVARVIAPGFSAEQQALTVSLMRIMLAGTVVFGAGGLVMGALNATQHFLWPAVAPVAYNVAILLAAWLLAPTLGVTGLAIGVVAGSVIHLAVQLPQLVRTGARYTPSVSVADPSVREVLRLMGPRVLGLLFVQMHFLVNTILASGLAAGSLSALNFAWLIMLLPLGIFAQSVATTVFPTLSAQVAAGETAAMRHTYAQTLRTVLFVVVPSAVGLILFGQIVVAMLFERGAFGPDSTALVASALALYALGLMGHATLEITVRAFYAMHNTWTPVLVGVGAMVLSIALGIWWVGPLGFGGLALANSVATTLEALLLVWLVRRSMGSIEGRALANSLLRTAAAAGVMAAVLWGVESWIGERSGLQLLVAGSAGLLLGAGVYLGVSLLLRHPELKQAVALVRRRRPQAAG
jgi:putative peptidoglycan lipid II flippase